MTSRRHRPGRLESQFRPVDEGEEAHSSLGINNLAKAGQYIEFAHLVSGTNVQFHAFITQFEDRYESEWAEEGLFGRMDPLSTFKRTGRKISLGWEVVANSPPGAVKNLENISKLIRMLYPSYSSGGASSNTSNIAGPPLLKLKFMNLITNSVPYGHHTESGLLGYVKGFAHAPILEEGFIESGDGKIYPRAAKFQCDFTVLHTHDMGWDEFGFWRGSTDYPYGSGLSMAQMDDMQAARQEALDVAMEASDAGDAEEAARLQEVLNQLSDALPGEYWIERSQDLNF